MTREDSFTAIQLSLDLKDEGEGKDFKGEGRNKTKQEV
jgi:hypothetical protein